MYSSYGIGAIELEWANLFFQFYGQMIEFWKSKPTRNHGQHFLFVNEEI